MRGGAIGSGSTAMAGRCRRTRSRILSGGPILTCDGKRLRTTSLGLSALTASTNCALRRRSGSGTMPVYRPAARAAGLYTGMVPDPDLLRNAQFVLAVNADKPSEVVRSRFPSQVKIGPPDKIRDLVRLHLP